MTIRAVLAVDEGTTNSKAALVGEDGRVLALGSAAVPTRHPQSGWVEQDAEQIWTSTVAAIKACLAQQPAVTILALGISNQRESIMVWDRHSGKPLGPVITWQCRRSATACEALKAAGHEADVLRRTGLPIDPLFPAPKVAWLLKTHCAGLAAENVCVGTVDSWLIWKFSGGRVHATDSSNAARTQLFNLAEMRWDQELCDLFGVPMQMLPQVCDSSAIFGTTLNVEGLADGIAIAAAIGDSHAALFGHGAFQPGDGKITFGTGSSVMTTVAEFVPPPKGLTTTIAWSLAGVPTYAFEGNILVSASILPWTAALLGLSGVEALLDLAQSVSQSDGVSLVPAHVGLGSPHWNSAARGVICGLSFSSGPAQIARAAVESIAFQVQDVFALIAPNVAQGIGRLFVDGGPSRNAFLMALVADTLAHPVITSQDSEASALGAAYLAGLAVGLWPNLQAIEALKPARDRIAPTFDPSARETALQLWQSAIRRSTLPA